MVIPTPNFITLSSSMAVNTGLIDSFTVFSSIMTVFNGRLSSSDIYLLNLMSCEFSTPTEYNLILSGMEFS